MSDARDEEFIRFAVAGGYLTEAQGEEALAALAEIEKLGGRASAPEMLQRRGLLDDRRAGLIHQAIAASKTTTTVPTDIAGFELLEKIGQGAMGTVFKARQKDLDRIVAVKVLSPRLARNKDFVARFLREARAAARLSHPNIVGAIDVGESQGFFYFAMEYVDGETLASVLHREGQLPEARALAVAADVARALDHAWQRGIGHRDIKPGNIMLARDGRVRVTDFGLAKAIGQDAADGDRFLGTPAYVAPEQIRSEPDIDCRADIFSLGVTLFQMLTGRLPFQGPNPMAIAAAVVTEPLPSVRTLCPELRIATARLVEKMTAKDRIGRHATPAELVAAIESAAGAPRPAARARPGTAKATARPAAAGPFRTRRRGKRYAIASVLITAAFLGVHVLIFTLLFPNVLRRWDRDDDQRRVTGVVSTAIAPTTGFAPPPQTRTTAGTASAVGKILLGRLRSAFDDAKAYASGSPRAYASQIRRYRQILDHYSGDKKQYLPREGFELLVDVRRELKRVESLAQTALDVELSSRQTRANELFKAGKVADALRLFDALPPELQTDGAEAELARLRDRYRQRALTDYGSLDARGKKLIEEANLAAARSLYTSVKAWGVPEVTRRADQALRTIDKLLAHRQAELKQAAEKAYPVMARQVVDRLAARDYDGARKAIDAALVDPKLAAVRDRLRPFGEFARAAGEVWARVLAAAGKARPGELFRIGGIGGKFVRIEGDKVYLDIGGAIGARPLADLRSAEAVALAQAEFGTATAQVEAKLGLFLLAEQEHAEARKRLEAAREGGADVAAALDLLGRIAPRPCPTCKGERAVACPKCGGQGYTAIRREPCDACNRRGWFTCRKCRGRGYLICANCRGTGQIQAGFRCMQCYGTGRIDCDSCKGGKVKCRKCGGDGVITNATPCDQCQTKKQIPCPECGGKGHLPPLDLPPKR